MADSEDRQILGFKHRCTERHNVFCLDQVPDCCPLCHQMIEEDAISELRVLPSPLKPVSSGRCALAIRPSKGNFLSDYKTSSDLHICLTTSRGEVAEFDQKGARLTADPTAEWNQCLLIKVFDPLSETIQNLWDARLDDFVHAERWARSAYDPLDNNCFDFVLEFLRSLELDQLKHSTVDKTKFCEVFIVPRTKLLARYISLYRKVDAEKAVVLLSE